MPAATGSNRPLVLLTLLLFATLFYLAKDHRAPTKQASRTAKDAQRDALVIQAGTNAADRAAQRSFNRRVSSVKQQRIVAVGDVHGDLPALMAILRNAGISDLKGHWIAGSDILVQTGDIVDRGPDTIALYKFFQTLRGQAESAGGAVISLLGNHEMMNELGDWRYVTKEDIASFHGERNRREAFLTGWIGQEFRSNYSITARVPFLPTDDDSSPFFARAPRLPATLHSAAHGRFIVDPEVDGPGVDSRSNPFRLAAASFVHGGITPEYLASLSADAEPISTMNRIGHDLLASLLTVPGHAPLGLPRTAPPEQREFWSARGPMWNRDWALEDEEEICDRVEEACERLRVRHLIQGHTPQFEGILSRCDGKILLIDTGISRAYGGAHSSLSISYTLTPASALSVQDALAHELVSTADADPEATLQAMGDSIWLEEEVVEALYTRGRETELIGRWQRVIEEPERAP
ncbi:hypothetical protein JCM8202_000204 [Rhodotorula sphaerocarpa]